MEISQNRRIIIRQAFQSSGRSYCLESALDRNSKKLVKGVPVPIAAMENAISAASLTKKIPGVNLQTI